MSDYRSLSHALQVSTSLPAQKDRRIHNLTDCARLPFSRFGSDGGTSLRVGESSRKCTGKAKGVWAVLGGGVWA